MNPILEQDLEMILSERISWDKLKNKTVLITGASGMVGSYMMYTLLKLNDLRQFHVKVIAVIRNVNKIPKEIREREDILLKIHDVTEKFVIEGDVDYIIHAASPASPLIMQNQPVETIAANTIGTFNTLLLAKEKHAEGYMFISSRERRYSSTAFSSTAIVYSACAYSRSVCIIFVTYAFNKRIDEMTVVRRTDFTFKQLFGKSR